jgi:DNA polymerase III delta prime subunit
MFFILYDADKLTDLISNKLLKVLEEPHSNHTLILLNPKNTKLLPTIASRTINLRLPIPSEVTPIEINEIYTKGMSFHEFQNKNRAQEKQLLSILLNAQFEDFKALDALTNLMKTHQESLTYHHSAQTRMYLIYQFLEQHL